MQRSDSDFLDAAGESGWTLVERSRWKKKRKPKTKDDMQEKEQRKIEAQPNGEGKGHAVNHGTRIGTKMEPKMDVPNLNQKSSRWRHHTAVTESRYRMKENNIRPATDTNTRHLSHSTKIIIAKKTRTPTFKNQNNMNTANKAKRSVSPSAEQPNGGKNARTTAMSDDMHGLEEITEKLNEDQENILLEQLKSANIAIVFTLSAETAKTIMHGIATIDRLRTMQIDIEVECRRREVRFEELRYVRNDAGGELVGTLDKMTVHAWYLTKSGFITINGARIYAQAKYCGGNNSNLSLTQLEYANDNKMSGSELRTFFRKLGATDVTIVVHKTKLQQSNKWTTAMACNVASRGARYAFRVLFPSEHEANKVYSNYLKMKNEGWTQDGHLERKERATELNLLMNTEWCRENSKQQRVTSDMLNERRSRSVRLGGVTSDNSMGRVRRVIEELGYQNFIVQMQSDHAIIMMKNETDVEDIISKYGPEGDEKLMNGQQHWRPKKLATISTRGCFRCGVEGHYSKSCPGKTQRYPPTVNDATYAIIAKGRTPATTSSLAIPEQAMSMMKEMVAAQVSQEMSAFRSQTESRMAAQERQITRNSDAIGKVEHKIDNMASNVQQLSSMMQMMMSCQNEMKAMLQVKHTQGTQGTDADMQENY